MALRLGFHRTLFKLGNCGLVSVMDSMELLALYAYNFWNSKFSWYMILGVMWLFYGIFYLFILLPIKGISKIINKIKNQKLIMLKIQIY